MDYIHISGTIDTNGIFTPGWWSTPPVRQCAMPPDSNSEARWIAVALDKANQVLARVPALLVEMPMCPGGSRLELRALLPLPDATSAVAILDGDREVFRRTVAEASRVNMDKRLS
jgi:hypothetical protein